MMSISSTSYAALIVLQQVQAPADRGNDTKPNAVDQIAAIVNGGTGGDSPEKTRAAARINSGMLDAQQAKGDASAALTYLESGKFKSSDPSVKQTLKMLISEDSERFAALVEEEKATKPGITNDNAIANAIYSLIESNREQFPAGEFVIGFRFANGGSNIINMLDANGNSTRGALSARHSANIAALITASETGTPEGSASDDGKMRDAVRSLQASISDQVAWTKRWRDAFGF
ncbi:hypothetical protein ACIQUG_10740 [Ensifer sp. NPDC090286]|uniref:hypothetical protein n=1 Tax=Ensifer sp. NPDC090286 TaxID=3363991 RepID=UPI00383AF998